MTEKLITIVEDEEDIVKLVSHHLKREGFKVKEIRDRRVKDRQCRNGSGASAGIGPPAGAGQGGHV